MKHTKLYAFIGVLAITCLVGIVNQRLMLLERNKNKNTATFLASCLSGYDFDSIEVDVQENSLVLKKYISVGSTREKEEVAIVLSNKALVTSACQFKNIRSFYDGLFFATYIDWNGSWYGIWISESMLPTELEKYVANRVSSETYWLVEVPAHVVDFWRRDEQADGSRE